MSKRQWIACLFSGACETGKFRPQPPWMVLRRPRKQTTIHAWTKIGAAFPHKEGLGFSIELKAFPVYGRLVVLPPDTDDKK
jgi:hypothetical protein